MKATCVLENKNSQLLLGCADRRLSVISEGQRGKKAISQSDHSLIHAMVTLF